MLADGIEAKGGIERITLYLARQLPVSAPDLTFFTQKTRLRSTGLARHLTVPLALGQFAVRCLTRRVGLVHINLAPRGSTPRKMLFEAAARAFGAKVIIHLHGGGYAAYYASLGAGMQERVRRFFQRAERIIVLGADTEAFVRDQLGVRASRIDIVVNGVPAPAGVAAPGSEVPTIVVMGKVGPGKGTDVFLHAVAELARRGHAFKAVIGGNGEVERFSALAAELGIDRLVRFAGWLGEEEVDATMRAGDIFVLPSRVENQPVAILEAMARGLPVVSTRVGAIPEQVVDGETGLLVSPGESAPLADAIERLIRDPAERQRLGAAGRERWRESFSVLAMTDKIAAVYRRCAERSPLKG